MHIPYGLPRYLARLLLGLTLILPALAVPADEHVSLERHQACVVLLHGLWRSGLSMLPVEWHLEGEGFATVNVTYPSLSHTIPELADRAVSQGVTECRERGFATIHFVTHSLGGILVRQYLASRHIDGLGRVVMLGPPNQGSRMADFFLDNPVTELYQPVALEQLGTGSDSVPLALGPVDFELGVIAGTINRRSFLPGVPVGVSDGTVSVAETVVPGMVDFLLVPAGHTFIMWNAEALEQTSHFLKNGSFVHSPLAE